MAAAVADAPTDSALILVGPPDSRMRALTDAVPQALLPVAGRSPIDRSIERLRQAGCTRIVISLDPLLRPFVDLFASRAETVVAAAGLGSGGAVQEALPRLGTGPFLVLNGNGLWHDAAEPFLVRLGHHWRPELMSALLMLQPLHTLRGREPEDRGDYFLEPHGLIRHRGDAPLSPYVLAGAGLFQRDLFEGAPLGPQSLMQACARAEQQGRLHGFLNRGLWFDVRTPKALQDAEETLARLEAAQPAAREEVFGRIYETNYWAGESRSGQGSDLVQTAEVRRVLPLLMQELGASSLLDLPCGDFHWMKEVALPGDYIGGDIVGELVRQNNEKYGSPRRRFVQLDACNDDLPRVDLILARDMLVHLCYADIVRALRRMKASGSTWLLATTFPERDENRDIVTGDWRPLNLQRPPLAFPPPHRLVNEHCTQDNGMFADKSLGLWRLQDLPIAG